jgi:hypothetical protein
VSAAAGGRIGQDRVVGLPAATNRRAMSKPQGTYLRTHGVTRIAHAAEQSKSAHDEVAQRQRRELEVLLRRHRVDFMALRRLFDDGKRLFELPKTRRAQQLQALGQVLQDLDDLADAAARNPVLTGEVEAASRLFLIKTRNLEIDGVDLTKMLVAMVMFVAVLEKALLRFRSGR